MKLNQGYSYRQVLDQRAAGLSTLSYLVRHFAHSTEAQWKSRLQAGEILVDDTIVDGQEVLRAGAVLIWNRPGWLEQDTPQSFGVVYHDEHLLVVDKPSGLPTLPGAGYYLNTLLKLVQNDFPAARPLHRLGRATSGLVLFAMNTQIAATLSQRWSQVRKQYVALGSRVATQASYDIRAPIGRQPHPRLGRVHAASATGKPAHSVARTLQRRANSTVFEVDLLTGRPHQIRIHLAFIGHPLEGDPLYAVGGQPRVDEPGLPGDAGYWLHAQRLTFAHPRTNEPVDVTSPPPEILRCS